MTQPNMPHLPGFDVMADTLEFVKNMWGGMQGATGIPGMPMPMLSLEEINKQIADLKAVESWLNVNMSMLRGTIQALEVQSATIASLHAMGATFGSEMKPHAPSASASSSAPNTSASAPPADKPGQPSVPAVDINHLNVNAAADATAAWWNALQTQFNQAVNSVMADDPSTRQKQTTSAQPSTTATKKSAAKSGTKADQSKADASAETPAKTAVKKRRQSAKT
ncbi:PhaM family polyhydroxyalkanoate granule multifunctional regulatory protein [Herminiimonas aquatilis]|uniref:PhaM family polyhydroxyalkanoate granule multifunctional regulatory protein n=1 Tax=Herminiimonas aquatilis TaxID=345342 RepID=A0ABW2J654_9BURK